jgi:hypothetical protein
MNLKDFLIGKKYTGKFKAESRRTLKYTKSIRQLIDTNRLRLDPEQTQYSIIESRVLFFTFHKTLTPQN